MFLTLGHTCLPQNCIFGNKNHQNPEHSIIFQKARANVSQHLLKKSSYQTIWENQRAIQCTSLTDSAADHARLSASSIISQQYRELESSFKCHLPLNSEERPLLMVCFLKRLEMSPFHERWFCKCMINRLCHAFPRTQNILTNDAPIPKIYSASSFVDAMFSSGNFGELCCVRVLCALRAHEEHFQQQNTFPSFMHAQCIQKWLR